MKHLGHFFGVTLVSISLVGALSSADAATRTVTNINDIGAGSLRAAITAASSGDAIVFSNTNAGGAANFYDGVQRVITLASALPNLSQNITITGPGADVVTVRRHPAGGTPAFRIFTISNGTATGPTVSISGLTINNGSLTGNATPGSCGAGILNDRGTLTLDSVAVSGNSTQRDGGGIYNYGLAGNATLRITASRVSSNGAVWGGGIFNDGFQGAATLSVRGSTISGNTVTELAGGIITVGAGGGSASAMVRNSTLSGNSAGLSGGAIENVIGSLTVTNSTFSGNSSGQTSGAIYNGNGGNAGTSTLRVNSCTFSNNAAPNGGGCIFNEQAGNPSATTTAVVQHTIFSRGGAAGGTLVNNGGGSFTSDGFNLSSDNGGGFLTATGDQINTDPMLGPLQQNGGATMTHALQSNSPAIDAGQNGSAQTVDQRGAPRPINGNGDNFSVADIGAVEFGSVPNGSDVVVNSPGDIGPGTTCDATHCSLAEAITEANSIGGANTITFHPATFSIPRTISRFAALPDFSSDITIRGPGAKLLTVERNDSFAPDFRIFNIPGGLNVAISGLTIQNGRTNTFGGGIYSASALTLTDCLVISNHASAGAGVAIDNSSALFTGCTFSANTATNQGGAINYAGSGGTLTLRNCTISGNTATGGGLGGGIFNVNFSGTSTLSANNCTIANNTGTNGGGIRTEGSGSGASAMTFLSNTILASNSGGNLRAFGSGGGTGSVTSQGYNLSSDNGNGSLTAIGDQINTNPLLDPNGLQDNGGPTPTIALQTGSPAIDKGKDLQSTGTDQRGSTRPYDISGIPNGTGDGSDIGAFEVFLQPISAASRKTHAVGGTLDVPLPLTGAAGVECRTAVGGNHVIVVTWNNNVVSGNVTVAQGTATPSAPFFNNNFLTVSLSGVSDAQSVVLAFTNVTDSSGHVLPSFNLPIKFLLGDGNGNGAVNSSDVSQTKIRSGQATDSQNFRSDFDLSGAINASDISLAKSRSGNAVP